MAPQPVKACFNSHWIARVQNVVFKSPVLGPLEDVCFALAVAASEHSVNGGWDAPHLCDATGWTWHPVSVQEPEVVPSENHYCAVPQCGDSTDRPPTAQICIIAVICLVVSRIVYTESLVSIQRFSHRFGAWFIQNWFNWHW